MAEDKTILIPIRNSEESVEVPVSELPDDTEEITKVLQDELAPIEVWLRFAVEYYRQGRHAAFQKMLEPLDVTGGEITTDDITKMYEEAGDKSDEVKSQLAAVLHALAAFHTVQGSRERDKEKKKEDFKKAMRYYDLAEALHPLTGALHIGPAVLLLCEGKMDKAEKKLSELFDANTKSKSNPLAVPALLSKAWAKYIGGNYRDALKLYRMVFDYSPSPPSTVRLGLAYCYHRLGQPRLAQRSLERTLALQPDCVDAMVGLAVLHLNEQVCACTHGMHVHDGHPLMRMARAVLRRNEQACVHGHARARDPCTCCVPPPLMAMACTCPSTRRRRARPPRR